MTFLHFHGKLKFLLSDLTKVFLVDINSNSYSVAKVVDVFHAHENVPPKHIHRYFFATSHQGCSRIIISEEVDPRGISSLHYPAPLNLDISCLSVCG